MQRYEIRGPLTENELNKINQNYITLWNMRNVLQKQINDLIIESGTSDAETIQARGNFDILGDRLNYIDTSLARAEAKADNPVGAMQSNSQKITLDLLDNDVKDAMTGTTGITTAKGYFENNRGVDYPLKNMVFNGEIGGIVNRTKNAILDAKVFGAKIDKVYRLLYVANGFTSNGKERWGITLAEYDKASLPNTNRDYRFIFVYNDDSLAGNEGNANYVKGSDGIDTITVDNGEIACSVTVDRGYLSNNNFQAITITNDAPTAFIDPSNYFF